MTRDDIIRVAREFGWAQKDIDSLLYIVETAAAAEREACAKLCDEVGNQDANTHAWDAAAAIRARGESNAS
jgi:hypothetical protein